MPVPGDLPAPAARLDPRADASAIMPDVPMQAAAAAMPDAPAQATPAAAGPAMPTQAAAAAMPDAPTQATPAAAGSTLPTQTVSAPAGPAMSLPRGVPAAEPRPDRIAPPEQPAPPARPAPPDRSTDGAEFRVTCTTAQLRRFIKSRPWIPMHELRRRFGITGDDDGVSPVRVGGKTLFVGLPAAEARLMGELLASGDVGYELSLDPVTPVVVGVYPMRPVPRG
jgi:hypothetical protein